MSFGRISCERFWNIVSEAYAVSIKIPFPMRRHDFDRTERRCFCFDFVTPTPHLCLFFWCRRHANFRCLRRMGRPRTWYTCSMYIPVTRHHLKVILPKFTQNICWLLWSTAINIAMNIPVPRYIHTYDCDLRSCVARANDLFHVAVKQNLSPPFFESISKSLDKSVDYL